MHQDKASGIPAMIAAVFCFALMDACMKQLVATYPSMQVAFFRGAAGLPLVLAFVAMRRDWRGLVPTRPWLHVARGLLSVVTLYTFVYSVSILSLADAYSIFLVAPLLVTAFSVPILREHVGWSRWAAILVGLLGALIMLRPSGSGLATLGGLAALLSATTYALGGVMIRLATRTDTTSATVFGTLLVLTCVAGVLSIRNWVDFQPRHWHWMAMIGVTGYLGQMLLTEAFRRCAAGVVAPFEYTALLWGVTLDWLLWQLLPNQRMLSGATIVVASGLYVIYRENRKAVGPSVQA